MKHPVDMTSKGRYVVYGIVLLLPFLAFYWMFPFLGALTIGNDYSMYSMWNQMELMFSIKHGSFPLYIPGYAAGSSFTAPTLAQIFHPFPHLAALLPGYWSGKALELNTLLHLLSLGFTQLVLLLFLRRLKLRMEISFVLSFITVYNLRMLDLLRYGASLENYTAFLLLGVSLAWYYIKPSKGWGPLCIIGSTYLLVCGGHPQMMYFGLIALALVTLLLPYYLSAILPELQNRASKVWRFYLHTFIFCSIGILMSSVFVFPFYFDFLTNTMWVKHGYEWASHANLDTFGGTLNNFFRPLNSDVHGAFGGSSLFLVAAIIPLLLCFKVKVPRVILFVWGLLVLTFLYMQGPRTPIHYFVWSYFPFASSFRIPGRVSMILPFIILLLLVWLISSGNKISFRFSNKDYILPPYMILTVLALITFIIYNFIIFPFLSGPAYFNPVRFNSLPSWVISTVFWSGAISLAALIFYGFEERKIHRYAGLLLCLATFLQTGTALKYGTWINYSKHDTKTLAHMRAEKVKKLAYSYYGGGLQEDVFASKSLKFHLSQMNQLSWNPTFLGKVYRNYTVVSSQEETYKLIKKRGGAERLIVQEYVPPSDSENEPYALTDGKDRVALAYSSFNRLNFDVSSHRPAFFVFSFPYTRHWQAYVNSEEARIYRANGIEQAVRIPSGESQVEFRYWSPAAFWGTLVSCLTLLLILLYFSMNFLSGKFRLFSVIGATGFVVSIFLLWYLSLYSGENLGTESVWTSKERPSQSNSFNYENKVNRLSPARAYPH